MKRFAAAIIFISFLLILPMTGFACKCVEKSPELLYEEADAVFKGKLVDANEASTRGAVDVTEIWKGTNKDGVYVNTDDSSCGFRFEVGQEYIFYAEEDEGQFKVTTCSGTFSVNETDEDRALGKGIPPSQQVTLEEVDGRETAKKWGEFSLVGIVLVIFIALLIRIEEKSKKR
jgi:hypothetical protein